MSKSMSTPRQCFRPGKPSTQSCAENTEKGSPAACGSTRPGELLFVLDGLAGQGLHKNRMEMDGNYRWKGVDSYILIVVVLDVFWTPPHYIHLQSKHWLKIWTIGLHMVASCAPSQTSVVYSIQGPITSCCTYTTYLYCPYTCMEWTSYLLYMATEMTVWYSLIMFDIRVERSR